VLLNGQRINGKKPFEINRLGLSRSFQITNIFPKLSVFENLRCGVLWSLGYKYTFLKFLADLDDANERAEELMEMIKLDKKRDVLAMNLTYAEQRALEIGITIAGGANVILLDEPTAGMSKSETARFIELIKEVTVGKTLLTVEHDMGVVFGLADKIAVVVYGEVLAFDTPEAVRANQRVQEAYLGSHVADAQARERTDMLKIDNLHAYYGKSHVLHGVHLRGGPGRNRRPAGAQRLGPLDHRQGHHGHGGLPRAPCSGRARRPHGPKGLRDRPPGHGLRAREPRHLPQLTVHQNLLLGPERRGKGSRWSFDDMYAMFPRLKERQHTEAGVLSGGEQQMLTLCRTLMGDPDLIIIDEPTEGLAPKIVELVGEYLQQAQGSRHFGAADRAEADHRDDHLGPRTGHGPRQHRVPGHAGQLRADAYPQGMARSLGEPGGAASGASWRLHLVAAGQA
jgi:branched-chain amino acid transport system ATP-binding protein